MTKPQTRTVPNRMAYVEQDTRERRPQRTNRARTRAPGVYQCREHGRHRPLVRSAGSLTNHLDDPHPHGPYRKEPHHESHHHRRRRRRSNRRGAPAPPGRERPDRHDRALRLCELRKLRSALLHRRNHHRSRQAHAADTAELPQPLQHRCPCAPGGRLDRPRGPYRHRTPSRRRD